MEEETQMPRPDVVLQQIAASENLAAELDEGALAKIGQDVLRDYRTDKDSMGAWFDLMQKGLDLAALVKDSKEYPFKGAANIKYPLIASAALQFNARAYPAIVPSDQIMKATTYGKDPQGQKAARADRVAAYGSFQLSNEIEEWEEETDKLLLQLPIVGDMYRKVWFDPVQNRPVCKLIEPGKYIVNKKVKSLADAPRCTEEIELFPAEIETRINSGQFIEWDYRQGDEEDKPHEFIEQQCRLDLDEDGYSEPYIVMMHVATEKVVKVVADFDPQRVVYKTAQVQVQEQVVSRQVVVDDLGRPYEADIPQIVTRMEEVPSEVVAIQADSYVVHYTFWPSMSGGFQGVGLGLLLADISDTINTIMNQMLDAGHYASLGGGFIGADFRVKGGAQRFRPGEWKQVTATGDDIRKSMVPMTFPGPDGTLFSLLGMLIDAGREIASVKDIMTGDTGTKNMTATTTIALIEQGMMVFTAAYKRIFRSLKKEFGLICRINRDTLSAEKYSRFHDEADEQGQPVMFNPKQDFATADMDIRPVADPRSVTKMQEAAKAQLVMQMLTDGMPLNPMEAASRVLEAMDIGDVDQLIAKPDPQQVAMQQRATQHAEQMAQADLVQKMADVELTLAKVEQARASAASDLAGIESDRAEHRLDAMRALLEAERNELERAIKTGRMAREPGDGGNARPDETNAARPAGTGPTSLLERQPMAGGGQVIPQAPRSMGGGLL